jgi:hypothetical protein
LVYRTFDGGMMEGNKYRVRMIKSWNSKNKLVRSRVQNGQVLIFLAILFMDLLLIMRMIKQG